MCGNDIKKLFEKTKFIVFKSTKKNADFNNLTLEIGGKKIERIGNNFPTKSFKFVGINIDENLSCDYYYFNKVKSRLLIFKLQE